MNTFNVGDKVYCPMIGTKVYTLEASGHPYYPLGIAINKNRGDARYFSFLYSGVYMSAFDTPILFHATAKNKKLLDELYGLDFEAPEPEMVKVGNFEFPKPESKPLKEGERFYIPALYDEEKPYVVHNWYSELSGAEAYLKKGIVHRTKEAAIQHARVLLAISQGKTSLEE